MYAMISFFVNHRGLMEFQHVDPQAAVEIHEDIKSNFSLGIHWGTFNLSYEVNIMYNLNQSVCGFQAQMTEFITK